MPAQSARSWPASSDHADARVLVLEAGPAVGRTWAEYEGNVEQYQSAEIKVPNTPYVSPEYAPSPNVLDIRKLTPGSLPADTGYFVQDGPLPFGTDYLRSQGGTMLHWLGTCLRMVPDDFEIASRYKRGIDWPISYDELAPLLLRSPSGNSEWQPTSRTRGTSE